MIPIIAIIGRANVGKSTLFNRLSRSRRALVDNLPGVTRDRHYGKISWDDRSFILIDTGGMEWGAGEVGEQVRQQAEMAIDEADVILFLLDGRQDPLVDDAQVARLLRRSNKPTLTVVNKIDGPGQEMLLGEFYRLGLSPLYPISAEHNHGISAMMEAVIDFLPPAPAEMPVEAGVRIAVLGRPNVGKSSLINRVLGEERLVIGPLPGTTRDAIETPVVWDGKNYVLIDTAGIRRQSRIWEKLEKGMVWQSFRALEGAHVAIFLIDAQEGITEQDLKIIGQIFASGKGCLIGINKWDLLAGNTKAASELLDQVKYHLEFMTYTPVLPLSVKTGYHLEQAFHLLDEIYDQTCFRMGTGELNRIFADIVAAHAPPRYRHRLPKFYYVTQADTQPPTFIAFVKYPQAFPDSYRRYLINQLRKRLNIPYAPIKVFFKGKEKQRRTGAMPRSGRRQDY
jgi:GTP-binding protein